MARTQECRKWANNEREQRNRRVNRSHEPCQSKQCAIHGRILNQQFRARKLEVNVHVKVHQDPSKRQDRCRLPVYAMRIDKWTYGRLLLPNLGGGTRGEFPGQQTGE